MSVVSATGGRETLSRPPTRHEIPTLLFPVGLAPDSLTGLRAGPESEDEVRRLGRCAGGADDGAIVFAQHLQPRADIVGMAHGRHDAE